MIQAEANAQLQIGASIVQLYTMSENILHKVRGNVDSGNDIMDAAFHINSMSVNSNSNARLRVDLSDIISDARKQQQLYQEVHRNNLLLRPLLGTITETGASRLEDKLASIAEQLSGKQGTKISLGMSCWSL